MRIFIIILDFIFQMICLLSGMFTSVAFLVYGISHEGSIILPLILFAALISSAFFGGYYYLEKTSGAVWKSRSFINGLLLSLVSWPALVFFGAAHDENLILITYVLGFSYLLAVFCIVQIRKKIKYRRAFYGKSK